MKSVSRYTQKPGFLFEMLDVAHTWQSSVWGLGKIEHSDLPPGNEKYKKFLLQSDNWSIYSILYSKVCAQDCFCFAFLLVKVYPKLFSRQPEYIEFYEWAYNVYSAPVVMHLVCSEFALSM